MGYSARYHVASLAAVFVALGVGILVGVGLGKNVVGGTTRNLERSLKGNLEDERARVADLEAELNRERDFSDEIYPTLVGGSLRGERVAVIALGGLPEDMKGDIEAVTGSGSPTGGRLQEFAVVREPPDLRGLTDSLGKRLRGPLRQEPDQLSKLAKTAGRSLIDGGPFFRRVQDALLARLSGRPGGIDAVILVRDRPDDLRPAESAASDALESGLLQGITSGRGVPVVGVERSDSDSSEIGFFQSNGIQATVDSVDLVSGQAALAYALAGAEGDFGTKESADRLLPALPRMGAARSP